MHQPARRWFRVIRIAGALFLSAGCADQSPPSETDLDRDLAIALSRAAVVPLTPPPAESPALVELGRALFFDKLLSGNKNIACATCHSLAYHSTDNLSLGIGTGGSRPGPSRRIGTGRFVARNTADLYNRGLPSFTSLFHDGRVAKEEGTLRSPAGGTLPPVASVLAAQAMFPVFGRDEMRGYPGDTTVLGEPNELALIPDDDFAGFWQALTTRLLAIPEYRLLFQAAFPAVDSADLGFHHAAEALAAFERAVFTQLDSPFDRFLAGDRAALSDSAKRGAILFYGASRCSICHSGALQTDQRFHNIGIPQLGPGFGPGAPLDIGRAGVTGQGEDRFAFRTPSLRNVMLTEAWMHNGAYTRIDAVVRHYRDPRAALRSYDPAQLDPRIAPLVHNDPATAEAILVTLDTAVLPRRSLSEEDIDLIVSFLRSLTDPAAYLQLHQIPDRVPSGLPLAD
jgi:cytochrome c peroxidase